MPKTDAQREIDPVVIDNGKYTFDIAEDGYSVSILRYGSTWVEISTASKAISSLMWEVRTLRDEVAALKEGTD